MRASSTSQSQPSPVCHPHAHGSPGKTLQLQTLPVARPHTHLAKSCLQHVYMG